MTFREKLEPEGLHRVLRVIWLRNPYTLLIASQNDSSRAYGEKDKILGIPNMTDKKRPDAAWIGSSGRIRSDCSDFVGYGGQLAPMNAPVHD